MSVESRTGVLPGTPDNLERHARLARIEKVKSQTNVT